MKKKIVLIIFIILVICGIVFLFLNKDNIETPQDDASNKVEENNKDEGNTDNEEQPITYPLVKNCSKEGKEFKFKYTLYVLEDGNFEKHDYYHAEIVNSGDTYFSVTSPDGSVHYEYSDTNEVKKVDLKDQTIKDANGNPMKVSYEYYKGILEASGYICD